MTYEELTTDRSNLRSWIAREKQEIITLNREITRHLEWIDMYENKLKQVEKDIIRCEVEQELEKGGIK